MNFDLDPRGPFSLEVARTFACGLFTASRKCSTDGAVRFAFTRDDDFEVAGVSLTFDGTRVHVVGSGKSDGVKDQVARILGVDRDTTAFFGLKDEVVQKLLAESPGFRPVVFFSPWAAIGWGVITQRLRMNQAAAIAERLAIAAGDVVEVDGEVIASFPRPQTFLARSGFEGIADEKWSRLQTVARAALEGELSMKRLAEPGARQRLLSMRGVGPWTAEAVMVRGVGPSDELPLGEPMLHAAVAQAYGLDHVPDDEEVLKIAEGWAPFRTWVSVLMVRKAVMTGLKLSRPQRGSRRRAA